MKEMTADKPYAEDEIYKNQMVQAYLEVYGECLPGEVVVCSKEAIVQREESSVQKESHSIKIPKPKKLGYF